MNSKAVADAVTGVVESLGLEVDRIETAAAGRRTVLRIFLDGDGASGRGPSLDEVAQATRLISTALDESPAVGNAPYVLEVSTRGATRPLTAPKHFRRNIGRLVAASLAGGGAVTGRIVAAGDDAVRLEVEGAEREFRYRDLARAVVQLELNRPDVEDADEPWDAEGVEDEED
jgi:ribosome maturation factor RimP